MKMSLGNKVVGMVVMLLVLSVVAVVFLGTSMMNRAFVKEMSQQLALQAGAHEAAVKNIMMGGNADHLGEYIRELKRSGNDMEFFLFDQEGKAVKNQQGLDRLKAEDLARVREVLRTKEILEIKDQDERIQRFIPLLNEQRCRSCHDASNAVTGAMMTDVQMGGFSDAVSRMKRRLFAGSFVVIVLISVSIWFWLKKALFDPILEVSAGMKEIATGKADLTKRIQKKSDDEIGDLAQWFNQVMDQIHEMVKETGGAASDIASAAEELSSTSEQITTAVMNQSNRSDHVATAIEEMAATVVEVAKNSGFAAEIAMESSTLAEEGKKVSDENILGMERISEIMQKSSEVTSKLSTRTQEIGEITRVIDDIADQTNLLALNAAIEAARAGEQGRGFAVVADEVRKLSERTSKATQEISEMIQAIQGEAGEAVVNIVEGLEEAENGSRQSRQVGDDLQEIVGKVSDVQEKIRQIAVAMEEASSAVDDISKNVTEISTETRQVSQGSEESLNASRQLSELAGNLQSKISSYNV